MCDVLCIIGQLVYFILHVQFFLFFMTKFSGFVENYTKKMFQLLVAAYSTISVDDAKLFLGMNEDDVTKCKCILTPFDMKIDS